MYIRLTVISNFSKLQFVLHILLLRNFYSPDAPNANHSIQRVNYHFRHGADSVYKKYSDFKLFEIAVCFAHFDFFEISTLVMRKMLTMANIVHIIISDIARTEYIRFTLIWNFRTSNLFCTFWLFRNFYSGDAQDANHGKYSSYHYFRHCAHRVYTIYIDLKLSKFKFVLHVLTFSKFLLWWCASF